VGVVRVWYVCVVGIVFVVVVVLPNIIKMKKKSRLRDAGHAAHLGVLRHNYIKNFNLKT